MNEKNKTTFFIKISVLVFGIFFMLNRCAVEEPNDILEKLEALGGVTVTEIVPQNGYPRAFQIDFAQPVDHNNPEGQWFAQRMYLSHVDEDLPMVFAPSGYAATAQSGQEIAGILQTNCLNVSHRYFTESRPKPVDWKYLTIRQAAADHHRIVKFFKTIYNGSWVSSGASKSGMTPIYHKRFYPEDVDAVIAYVAPFSFSKNDMRYSKFLASTGSMEDRAKIISFQRRLLTEHQVFSRMYEEWFINNGYSFSGDPASGFESRALSYHWHFYQYHNFGISDIPEMGAGYDEMFNHFARVSKISRSSDTGFDYFKPYYYQAYTELGYPGNNYDHLKDLIIYWTDEEVDPSPLYGIKVEFKPDVMTDIYQWVQNEGDNIIFIYGEVDPWTGGAVELTGQTNALKIIQPGGDHLVKIIDLKERQHVLSTLGNWLGITIPNVRRRGIRVSEESRLIEMGLVPVERGIR